MNKTIDRLVRDFAECRDPFDRDMFPEERLVSALGQEQKEGYLTLFCTLDYNRSADQLVENIKELAVRKGDYFDAEAVRMLDLDEMQATFEDIGFRYHHRDAKGWKDNCDKLYRYFRGDWQNLYAAAQYDAPTLVAILRKEEFKYLQGKKLAPFYARVVHDLIEPLDNIWMLDVPVDTHIRKLTQELLQKDMSDDEIREFWKDYGNRTGTSPHVVDGGLWQIGYSWDDWGQDYFEELTGRETFKYL